jgi:hypothetical protein
MNLSAPPSGDRSDSSRRPPNAFTARFLRQTEQLDEPETASEAEFAGPWIRDRARTGIALRRGWEGDRPFAVLHDEQTAQLAAALLPARGRLSSYRIDPRREPEGFALERHGDRVGHLAHFDEHFAEGLSLLEALLRNPAALAELLAAAGPTALEQVGRILHRQLTTGEGSRR